jgi:hypothetical protein
LMLFWIGFYIGWEIGIQSSTRGCPVFSTPFFEAAVFSPMCVFGAFVENQLALAK